jgi:uncharacterized protein (TIGR02391 family)
MVGVDALRAWTASPTSFSPGTEPDRRSEDMPGLLEILPEADSLMSLSAEDLGLILLELIQKQKALRFTPLEFEQPIWNANSPGYPQVKRIGVNRTIAEAWQWLQNEGLIMVDLDQPNGWFCLTRKGASITSQADVDAYQHGNLLPAGVMHPKIVAKVRPMFLRGDYDVAVVQAFKQVEIEVRDATGLPNELVGLKLMRTAYNPESGPLTDMNTPAGERQAVMELFSGAIGHGRNPPSHRDVVIARADAARLIGLASYLLELVDDWRLLKR